MTRLTYQKNQSDWCDNNSSR